MSLKSMMQSQNYSLWQLGSGAGQLISDQASFEQKYVASHELTPFF